MRMESSKIVLLVLCLAVCVGMCRPGGDGSAATAVTPSTAATPAPSPADGSSFSSWAYNKFNHVFGLNKGEEPQPVVTQTKSLQVGFGTGSISGAAPVEAPAPGPVASAPAPGAAEQVYVSGKEMAKGAKDKAEAAYEEAKSKVQGAYKSTKEAVTN